MTKPPISLEAVPLKGRGWLPALVLATALAGCSVSPQQKPAPPEPTPAVQSLLTSARADAAQGRFDRAEASLERALRLESHNPYLWLELARMKMRDGQFSQAENIALRADSFAGGNSALKTSIWELIADAREAAGNEQGARNARERARSY